MDNIHKKCTCVTRYNIFPVEIWLSIFKHMDIQDLFQKKTFI